MAWPKGYSRDHQHPYHDWQYWRLYADEACDHYEGFMREKDGIRHFLRSWAKAWTLKPFDFEGQIKLQTPPANLGRIEVIE